MKMTTLKTALLSAIVAGSSVMAIAPATAQAGVSANFGATTNYIWRGYTQNDNAAAVSGGLDYEMDNGVYFGTWASTVGSNDDGDGTFYEVDLYGGFAGSVSGLDYDIGYIYYAYPDQDDANFSEVYGSVGMMGATIGVNYTVSEDWDGDTGDTYVYASYEYGINDDFSVGALYGNQSYAEKDSDSYSHLNLTASYKDFTLALDKAYGDGAASGLKDSVNGVNDDVVVSLSYGVSFDLM